MTCKHGETACVCPLCDQETLEVGLSAVERIVSCMLEGWDLRNRGTGWYLSQKHTPYQKQKSEKVADYIVEHMEDAGTVRIEMLTRSMQAILI